MNISLSDQFNHFASDIMCDVCAHFLRTVYNIEKEYTIERSILYSEFGQKTLVQSLCDLPLEFYNELKNYSTAKSINNMVFAEMVSTITENSEFFTGAHATFYGTCGKVVIMGIVAMQHKCFTESKIHEEIVKMAKKAYALNILDKSYDDARKNAQSIFHTVFKINGTDISEFVTPIEREVGFEDFRFKEDVSVLMKDLGIHTNNILKSSVNLKDMNRTKLDFLVKQAIDKFNVRRNEDKDASNWLKYFLVLVIQVGCISLYCARNNFKAGVQHGFDYVTAVILKEKLVST